MRSPAVVQPIKTGRQPFVASLKSRFRNPIPFRSSARDSEYCLLLFTSIFFTLPAKVALMLLFIFIVFENDEQIADFHCLSLGYAYLHDRSPGRLVMCFGFSRLPRLYAPDAFWSRVVWNVPCMRFQRIVMIFFHTYRGF